MVLVFPHLGRHYDSTRQGIGFWAIDQTNEIGFFVENSAIVTLGRKPCSDVTAFLKVFDANRERICEVADALYSRCRKPSHLLSFTLTSSDF